MAKSPTTNTLDKSVYLKIWQQVNPLSEASIRTQKTVRWIQALLKHQQLSTKQPETLKQTKGKIQKTNKAKETKKHDKKAASKNKNDYAQNEDNKTEEQTGKIQQQNENENHSPIKNEISEEVILSYVKKYSQTEQYKLLYKSEQIPSEPQTLKSQKDKKSSSKQLSKKISKKSQPIIPQVKFDETIIALSYQEAIFFYYWFKKIYQKDSKQRFLEKIKQKQQSYEQQQLKNQKNTSQQTNPAENLYQPKHFNDLTERQMSYINEESFLSLKQHEPKLNILFKYYSKLSHVIAKQDFTFDQRNSMEKMTLHQWMVFCKEWNILNAKNINAGWEAGKVTREFLMDIYYNNSFLRKQMSLEMFLRAIISVSCRMYQDCDVYQVKPIDLMLNFLSIKNEQKFVQSIETKNISYRQGDILSCFKVKDRDVYEKMNIIKVTGKDQFKKSTFTLLRQRNLTDRFSVKDGVPNSHKTERNSQADLKKSPSEANILSYNLEKLALNHQAIDNNFSTGNLSKSSFNRKNRKSAPQIGVKLPNIDNNRFFSKIPQNNHLNKFREYIENEVPESSSVLRNKITGYHKIHSIQALEEEQKLGLKNKTEHMKISKLIGSKFEHLMGQGHERQNPELTMKQKHQADKIQIN